MWILGYASLAVAGLLAGPEGAPSPATDASRVLTWREGDQTVALWTQRVTGATDALAWITPLPAGVTVADVVPADPATFAALDGWSAPRVRAPTCDDLIRVTDGTWGEAPDAWGDLPVARLITDPTAIAVGGWEITRVDPSADAIAQWLADRGLALPPGGDVTVAGAANAGDAFVAARWVGAAPPDGTWLPPLRFRWPQPWWELPLRAAHPNTPALHDAVVYTLTPLGTDNGEVTNFLIAAIEDDCMPDGVSPEDALDATLTERLPGATIAEVWTSFASDWPGDASLALPPDLAAAGWSGPGRVTRLQLRYAPADLDQDIALAATAPDGDQAASWIQYDRQLEWAFPVCGLGEVDDPGTCPDITLDSRQRAGCAHTPPPIPAAAAAALLALRRRARRAAAVGAVAALTAAPARAGTDSPGTPPAAAVRLQLPVWSTPRLGDEDTGARGAPSATYPQLSGSADLTLWRSGAHALRGEVGLRFWAGRASSDPDEVYVLFTHTEPWVGAEWAWGGIGGRFASPVAAAGAGVAVGVLHPSAFRSIVSVGPQLHARAGAALGRKPTGRTELTLALTGIPRTAVRIVDLHPATGVPGFAYARGFVAVTAGLGWAFGAPRSDSPPPGVLP
jgi:hypothetical protein